MRRSLYILLLLTPFLAPCQSAEHTNPYPPSANASQNAFDAKATIRLLLGNLFVADEYDSEGYPIMPELSYAVEEDILRWTSIPACMDSLIEIAEDRQETPKVRQAAVWAFAWLAPDERIIRTLVDILREENENLTMSAMDGLVILDSREEISEYLLSSCDENDTSFNLNIILAWRFVNLNEKPLDWFDDEIAKGLNSSDPVTRRLALSALGWPVELKGDETFIPRIIDMLNEQDPVIRSDAVRVLDTLPKMPRSVIPRFCALLSDPSGDVRASALLALDQTLPPSEMLPKALRGLRDDDWRVRRSAVWSLGRIAQDTDNRQAIRTLLDMLDDEKFDVAWAAFDILDLDNPEIAAYVLPKVMDWIRSEDHDSHFLGIRDIDRFKQAAEPAIPMLWDEFRTGTPEDRAMIADALRDIGVDEDTIIDALSQSLDADESLLEQLDTYWQTRLVRICPGYYPYVLGLISDGDDVRARTGAVETLTELSKDGYDVIPILREVEQTDRNRWVRDRASGAAETIESGVPY